MRNGRFEVPLASTEMARLRDQIDPLIEVSHLNAEPTCALGLQLCREERARNTLAGIIVCPAIRAGNPCFRLEQSRASEFVDVELQSILKASSLSGSWHV